MKLSIIVPVLNEAASIVNCLERLDVLRDREREVIVVDGGSTDATVRLAQPLCDQLIVSPPGRGQQLNAGAEKASGDILLFLHADTYLPDEIIRELEHFHLHSSKQWGRFNLRLSGDRSIYRIIETMINLRSRLTGIAGGDQAIFIRFNIFRRLGGFKEIPLFEDVDFCRRMKKVTRPYCVSAPVITSSRRWETRGVWRTIWLMWSLRLAYYMGFSPSLLASYYR